MTGLRILPQGSSRGSRVGLAMAGGGPQGAVYELGALRRSPEIERPDRALGRLEALV